MQPRTLTQHAGKLAAWGLMLSLGTGAMTQNAPATPAPAGGSPQTLSQLIAASAQPPKIDLSKIDPAKVIVKAGDIQITAGQLNDLLSSASPQQREQLMTTPGALRMVANEIVQMRLLAQEAGRRKLDETPKFKQQMAMAHDQLLAKMLSDDVEKNIDTAELKKHFDDNKAQFDQVEARHILIRTPGSKAPVRKGQKELTDEQAKAKIAQLRERIVKGEDFGAVAKAESDDTGSGAQGGALGTFGHGQMVPEFDQVAFSLKKGEVSQPVKTQFGYHLIQVQERKDNFADYEAQLREQMGPQKIEQLTSDLKAKSKPELDESVFGPPPAAQPAAAPGAAPAAPGR